MFNHVEYYLLKLINIQNLYLSKQSEDLKHIFNQSFEEQFIKAKRNVHRIQIDYSLFDKLFIFANVFKFHKSLTKLVLN